jgi:16S rRNA (adenine1518-N6/adenine1519-N6)-dimethyltransferase
VSRQRHRAKRSLGQNFLVDPNLQRGIVEALEPGPEDEVLEIGPGQGALTRHLAGRVARLVLVELDNDLAAALQEEYADHPGVEVVHADILTVSLEDLFDDVSRVKVIGNIPYNITTPILFSLLERRPLPERVVLMVQKEVADRILAPVGSKAYGALSVGVRLVAEVERVLRVGRNAFRPRPDVDSMVIRLRPRGDRPDATEEAAVRTLTREAFSRRRKQLQTILRDGFGLDADDIDRISRIIGIDLRRRPETLTPEQMRELAPLVVPSAD